MIIGIILILIIIVWLRTPHGKGFIGETIIKIVLGKNKPGEKYVVNNLLITGENGKTSQIDHILINKNGIYVIETKNYSGRIYGQDSQLEWTQVLNYGKVKNHFYNPVKQNATHIYRIKEATQTKLPIKTIIVFIKGNTNYIKSDKVYTVMQMVKFINQDTGTNITKEEIEQIYNQILSLKQSNTTTITEHINNINKTVEEIEQGFCPRCGSKLQERKGKYGVFFGCSNYPNCKFTKK